jgi:hypothetical protein
MIALTHRFLWASVLVLLTIIALFAFSEFAGTVFFGQVLAGKYYDAEWYLAIASKGYEDWQVAFFPGFPLLLRLVGWEPLGICILNTVVFCIGFVLLSHLLKLPLRHQLLLQSFPGLIFLLIPYTESLFFLACTTMLWGMRHHLWYLLVIGSFIAAFTRPMVFVLLPAFSIAMLFVMKENRNRWLMLFSGNAALLAGTSMAFGVQAWYTGSWFSFFDVQEVGWGNRFGLPSLPFSSWSGSPIVEWDGFALWICLLCAFCSVKEVLKWENGIHWIRPSHDRIVYLFSLTTLAGTGLMIIFTRGGMLFSLNRFVFAVPFIIVVMHQWLSSSMNSRTAVWVASSFLLFSFFMGSYQHIQIMLNYLLISLWLLVGLANWNNKTEVAVWTNRLWWASLFIWQFYLAYRVSQGLWVG